MEQSLERGDGILMHISSIPSNYGIGTFGREAYDFVDKLSCAKQKYWQVLPLGPTSYGDNPYASFSAFVNIKLADFLCLERVCKCRRKCAG